MASAPSRAACAVAMLVAFADVTAWLLVYPVVLSETTA